MLEKKQSCHSESWESKRAPQLFSLKLPTVGSPWDLFKGMPLTPSLKIGGCRPGGAVCRVEGVRWGDLAVRILRVEATRLLFFSREQVRGKTRSSPAWVALPAPEAHDGSEFEE